MTYMAHFTNAALHAWHNYIATYMTYMAYITTYMTYMAYMFSIIYHT